MNWLWKLLRRLFGWSDKPTPPPEPMPEPAPEPTPTPNGQDQFSEAIFHTCNGAAVRVVPVVSDLQAKIDGPYLTLATTDKSKWPDIDGCCAEIHCLLFRGGKWHSGPCDGLRTNWARKEKECLCVPDGDTRLYTPKTGENVGVVITGKCRHKNDVKPAQRSAIAWVVWK